jgi:hypothetical protein
MFVWAQMEKEAMLGSCRDKSSQQNKELNKNPKLYFGRVLLDKK